MNCTRLIQAQVYLVLSQVYEMKSRLMLQFDPLIHSTYIYVVLLQKIGSKNLNQRMN